MSGFFWNVRGLNKSSKHSIIKKWVEENNFQFGCLLETRVREGKAQRLGKKLFQNWSIQTNYEHNARGRIWVLWQHNVRLSPFYKSDQIITCSVKLEDQVEEFFCSFVYASNLVEERKVLWQELQDHYDSPIFKHKPWLIMGDFNITLDMAEHSRVDDNPLVRLGMRDFQRLVNYFSISDMASHGPIYTWCNKRENDLIHKKLDRALVNDGWLRAFPQAYSVFEAGGCSDHLRCRVMQIGGGNSPKLGQKPFKFVNVLTEMMEFLPLVEDHWKETEELFLSTSTLLRFSKKLKGLKPKLRNLAKDRVGNLIKKSKEAYEILCQKQQANATISSTLTMIEENEAYKRWDKVADLEEKYLKQKSKLHWLDVGDKNNKMFHRAVAAREALNTIKEVVCPDGNVLTKKEDIKAEAERHFREFLQHVPSNFDGTSLEKLQQLMSFRCSEEDQQLLIRYVSGEEIKKVLFAMPNDKSPGPDGYTSEFYKASWTLIGKEFILAVQSFFAKGFLPKGINATILALIPKKKGVKAMKDFRPISCCNVIYKVISKIIANRLKAVLPKFIAGNQSTFVKDRLLIENVLLATKLVKDYHKDSGTACCAIKIDISKAFDSVQWSFLSKVLSALNFSPMFIHWIMLCVTTASFSVQVNGELAGYFRSSRGLRQGCSLSPYLFVISMDVLSKLLDRAAEEKKFGYHPRCKVLGLTHLSFADDLMVLSDGRVRSVEGITRVFDEFAKWSGLKISMEKSTLYLAGKSDATSQFAAAFQFDIGHFPVRYLGLPLVTKRLSSSDYRPLIEQIRKRIESWTTRFLSFAGRLNLISSILWSICNFWLAAYRLPSECIRELDQLCSAFLWSGTDMNSHKAKLSWENVCKPKQEGGLGLRSLKEANTVCRMKLIWRIVSNGNSLRVKWIQTYLLKQNSIWSIGNNSTSGSWLWKKLIKYRDMVKQFCKVEVGNGETTSFWYDNWSSLGRLVETVGARGYIDMGISKSSSLAAAWTNRRRRRHRVDHLTAIEEALYLQRQKRNDREDKALWRGKKDIFRPKFSTKDTWNHIRTTSNTVSWHRGVWFAHATPKYSFCVWLAAHNRLSTGARMVKWNQGASGTCIFCQNHLETRDHLFFSCQYGSLVWTALAKELLKSNFTTDWSLILDYISNQHLDRVEAFLIKYVFQAAVYTIWRERNQRRHGEESQPADRLVIWIDKQVRNQISSIRKGDKRYEAAYQAWITAHS